jgi:hypothetical protein
VGCENEVPQAFKRRRPIRKQAIHLNTAWIIGLPTRIAQPRIARVLCVSLEYFNSLGFRHSLRHPFPQRGQRQNRLGIVARRPSSATP